MGRYEEEPDDVFECFGMVDEYDPDDETYCQNCEFFHKCGVAVRQKLRNKNTRNNRNTRTSSRRGARTTADRRGQVVKSHKEPVVIIDAEEEDTFLGALAYNAGLEAAQAMAEELSNSIRHIPRKGYNGVFKRRKK